MDNKVYVVLYTFEDHHTYESESVYGKFGGVFNTFTKAKNAIEKYVKGSDKFKWIYEKYYEYYDEENNNTFTYEIREVELDILYEYVDVINIY